MKKSRINSIIKLLDRIRDILLDQEKKQAAKSPPNATAARMAELRARKERKAKEREAQALSEKLEKLKQELES